LFVGLQVESSEERKIEEAFIEVVELFGCLVKSDDGGFQFGFAFRFLVGRVDVVQIGVSEFPGQVQMRPEMVENLLEPALNCEFLGANFVFVIEMWSCWIWTQW
jgi:hypothetical protein